MDEYENGFSQGKTRPQKGALDIICILDQLRCSRCPRSERGSDQRTGQAFVTQKDDRDLDGLICTENTHLFT